MRAIVAARRSADNGNATKGEFERTNGGCICLETQGQCCGWEAGSLLADIKKTQ